jgi:thiamine-monophosphate kinase
VEGREAVITIADLGEFGLIAAIARDLPGSDDLIIGVGDDAAVLRAPDGRVVATSDLLIEGRHFRREWSSAEDVGHKAAARSLSDVAAMGARPTAVLVSFAGPAETPADWVLAVVRGIAAECAGAGACVAGGDTSSAPFVLLAITGLGDLAGRPPVTRGGAKPGDVVAVTGTLGSAAAGFALLAARGVSGASGADMADLVDAHRRPQPPYREGPRAAELGATAMIDVSDGLLADLGHVAAASGVHIDVLTDRLRSGPLVRDSALSAAATDLGEADWLRWVLTGGDDYALAATFPPAAVPPAGWAVIGAVTAGQGLTVDGREWSGPGGWDHFPAK